MTTPRKSYGVRVPDSYRVFVECSSRAEANRVRRVIRLCAQSRDHGGRREFWRLAEYAKDERFKNSRASSILRSFDLDQR